MAALANFAREALKNKLRYDTVCSQVPLLSSPSRECRGTTKAGSRRAYTKPISVQPLGGKPLLGHRLERCRGRTCATGGSVLDKPTVAVPGIDKSSDTQKKKPRIYRVLLHNDSFNKREYVVQVLLKVVKTMTVDDAVNVMQEAHQNGLACVIACAQEEAEQYCEGLRNNGLISSIEPDGPSSGGESS